MQFTSINILKKIVTYWVYQDQKMLEFFFLHRGLLIYIHPKTLRLILTKKSLCPYSK